MGKRGRKPNERPIRAVLTDILDEMDATRDRKRLWNVCYKLVEAAEDGEPWAVKELIDRVDGKSPVALTGEDGGPVETVTKIMLVSPDDDAAR